MELEEKTATYSPSIHTVVNELDVELPNRNFTDTYYYINIKCIECIILGFIKYREENMRAS